VSAQNFAEWTGDYPGAGIGVIRMDVNNFSSANDLSLRLAFLEFAGQDPVNIAVSTNPVVVPANSGWRTIQFDISPSALTPLLGSATGALSNAGEFRIFHNPAPVLGPGMVPAITATVGIDNITAVPEPSTWSLALGGLLLARFAAGKLRRS
jgi:hypothetical protein